MYSVPVHNMYTVPIERLKRAINRLVEQMQLHAYM